MDLLACWRVDSGKSKIKELWNSIPIVFSGAYCGKETLDLLRERKDTCWSLNGYFFVP